MGIKQDSKQQEYDVIYDQISKNVKNLRMKRKISQLDLGQEIGLVGNAFIARAENRQNNYHFNIIHLIKIAKVLDIDINELLLGVSDILEY